MKRDLGECPKCDSRNMQIGEICFDYSKETGTAEKLWYRLECPDCDWSGPMFRTIAALLEDWNGPEAEERAELYYATQRDLEHQE